MDFGTGSIDSVAAGIDAGVVETDELSDTMGFDKWLVEVFVR